MSEVPWSGLAVVVAAGVAQGSFMLPMKWTRQWAWENTWLVFACTAYLLCPWLLVLATIPQVFSIYASVPAATLAVVILFGVCWGVGAVTFGLGVAAVGMALGFPVILGLSACAGTLVPLLFTGASLPAAKAVLTGVALLVMLAGVAACSVAGRWKEKAPPSGTVSYRKGLAVCVISGVLSACGNIGFVYGTGIISAAQRAGVPAYLSTNVVWALLTVALFFANAGYAILLLRRKGTAARFRVPGSGRCFLMGGLMGVLWMAGFVFYGAGTRQLGRLGSSLGWAIMMSAMVLTANVLGILSGEWADAPQASRAQLRAGILMLTIAIAALAAAN